MPESATGTARGVESVRPLERGLAVLRALASAPAGERTRAGDLVRTTGLARSTVDRVVTTLHHLGLVRRQGQELWLTPRLMELGNAYLAASGPLDAVAARTARLADELDESVSLAVPDGDGVRFVAQATRRRAMSVAFHVGDLLPAERCAPGAVFATDWSPARWDAWRARRLADPLGAGFPVVSPREIRESDFAARVALAAETGHATDDQLIETGLIAVTVPVHTPDGHPLAALSAVSHTSRHSATDLADAVLGRLRAEAGELGRLFAGSREVAEGGGVTGGREDAEVGGVAGGQEVTKVGGVAGAAVGPVGVDSSLLPPDAKGELGPEFLQSLARGLAVLRALGAARGDGVPLTALAEATGLPRATARRCLLTLEQEGYATHTGRLFRPLPRVLELGYARLSRLSFAELAEPHLRDLVEEVHESASVTVLDGTDIRYVARVPTVRVMSVHIAPGTRFPAYATAMGRVLLAGLPDERRAALLAASDPRPLTRHTVTSPEALARTVETTARQGYATIDEELEEGLRSVAVPLRDARGRVVAALNVAQHSGTTPLATTRDRLLPALRRTAAAIEHDVHTASRFSEFGVS
ncbi:IclR family transcriptional regulator C-terminal domain-containing protein [Streptomyces sp. NPDC058001]|uniref:IclR family transcriptional regulator domain-containing protein n=1 Tax=Streptomyces sp. NPDC058001 TaxID=3346300 RepID=UPI0036EE066E